MNDPRTRVIQLLGMIGSAHDGEVLNAARLAQRELGRLGLSWEEFVAGNGGTAPANSRTYDTGYSDGFRDGLAKGRAAHVTRPRADTWIGFARTLRDEHEDDLNDWEQGFVESYVEKGWPQPTPKQRGVFARMAEKLGLELPD